MSISAAPSRMGRLLDWLRGMNNPQHRRQEICFACEDACDLPVIYAQQPVNVDKETLHVAVTCRPAGSASSFGAATLAVALIGVILFVVKRWLRTTRCRRKAQGAAHPPYYASSPPAAGLIDGPPTAPDPFQPTWPSRDDPILRITLYPNADSLRPAPSLRYDRILRILLHPDEDDGGVCFKIPVIYDNFQTRRVFMEIVYDGRSRDQAISGLNQHLDWIHEYFDDIRPTYTYDLDVVPARLAREPLPPAPSMIHASPINLPRESLLEESPPVEVPLSTGSLSRVNSAEWMVPPYMDHISDEDLSTGSLSRIPSVEWMIPPDMDQIFDEDQNTAIAPPSRMFGTPTWSRASQEPFLGPQVGQVAFAPPPYSPQIV